MNIEHFKVPERPMNLVLRRIQCFQACLNCHVEAELIDFLNRNLQWGLHILLYLLLKQAINKTKVIMLYFFE